MKNPFWETDTITASGNVKTSTIKLNKCRTLAVKFELTFGASIDADATWDAYFSPDGNNWDSLAYTSGAITYTANTVVSKTFNISVPEHGWLYFKITNGSSADTIDKVRVWKSIQSYD